VNEITAGAAVGAYVKSFTRSGPLDIVVRCATARFHFFAHIVRHRGGEISVYSVPGRS
jgi:hypothetical protein